MKYNPITNTLYTDDDSFIKKLHCPLLKQWAELIPITSLKGKTCEQCAKIGYDTAFLTDEEVVDLIKKDAYTCLKVDVNQPYITVTYHTNE